MATLIIRPTSDVLKTNWGGGGDSSNLYANVDESSLNESDYNLAGLGASFEAKQSVKIGSTVYRSSQFYLQSSATLHTWEMTVRPSDSQAWTWDDVDAFIGGCYASSSSNEILYGFSNHTTEDGTINKITLKSYLKYDGGKSVYYIYDFMTWAEVDYTEATPLPVFMNYYQNIMR